MGFEHYLYSCFLVGWEGDECETGLIGKEQGRSEGKGFLDKLTVSPIIISLCVQQRCASVSVIEKPYLSLAKSLHISHPRTPRQSGIPPFECIHAKMLIERMGSVVSCDHRFRYALKTVQVSMIAASSATNAKFDILVDQVCM